MTNEPPQAPSGTQTQTGVSVSKTPHKYPPAFESLLAQGSSRGAAALLLRVIVVISSGRRSRLVSAHDSDQIECKESRAGG